MDQLDDAAMLEQADRDRALSNQCAHREPEPDQWIEDGVVLCIDCAEPVSQPRLAAKPNAARCIDCQQLHERQDHC
jgi:DnaK suppressor protein